MKSTKSKHIFTGVIVIALCVLAAFLWGITKHVQEPPINMPQKTYIAPDKSFSFTLSEDFNVSNVADGNSQTTLFVGNSPTRMFTIRVSSWSSPDSLTINMINQQLPNVTTNDTKTIGVDGAKGVSFISSGKDGMPDSYEIWFTRGGNIYQISTTKSFDQEMINVLSTWKWQ